MINITINEFETSINSAKRVIIEFSAEWCGPCRMVKPILEEISSTTDICVYEVNVDEEIELAEKFGIRNIPTTLYYQNGKLIDKSVGAQSRSAFLGKFKEGLNTEDFVKLAKKFLHYSLSEIDYKYDDLTTEEQAIISKEDWDDFINILNEN